MGLGLLELVIIAVAALVLLGPERLPEVLRQLGRVYVQLRRTSNEFRGVFDHMVRQAEEELRIAEIKRLTDLANQGSKIAQDATADLHKFGLNPDPHHPFHNDHHPAHQTALPGHEVPAPLSAPLARDLGAANAWEQETVHPSHQADADAASKAAGIQTVHSPKTSEEPKL